jgi:hypothetical protein
VRRLSPYLIIALLIIAPFLTATLSAVHAGPPRQGEEEEPVTPRTDIGTFLVDVRLDLELLADEFNGPNIRPAGWNGNADPTSDSILGDIWLDLEAQADEVFEAGARPADWAGTYSPTSDRVARNLRHDLELLADAIFGQEERPDDWIGAPRLFSCEIAVQNLVDAMGRTFEFTSTTRSSVLNYCLAVVGEIQDRLILEGVSLLEGDIPTLLSLIRGDLERLADELYGLDTRPDEYLRTITIEANQMANDLLFDFNIIADDKFGSGNRPEEWIGSIGSSPETFVRNLRHDLELLSDLTLVGREDHLPDGRPEGWSGTQGFGDDLTPCSSGVQSLVLLMNSYYRYRLPVLDPTPIDQYCQGVAADVNRYAESEPEQITLEEREGALGATGRPLGASDLAFAYLDVGALQYMGTMPRGVPFEAWYRNFGESTMMYVVGENFALYVSQNWTTLPLDRFYRLPTLEGVIPETYCFAEWCAGPGPTPTPTGQAPTPTPGAAPGQPPPGYENLVLVPWNQVNIFYDQDRPEVGTVLVRVELCAAVGIGCEAVQSIYDASGLPLPVVSVIGPYPVFEVPYGYNNTLTLLSPSYYANEIWVSDPTLRGVTGP